MPRLSKSADPRGFRTPRLSDYKTVWDAPSIARRILGVGWAKALPQTLKDPPTFQRRAHQETPVMGTALIDCDQNQ